MVFTAISDRPVAPREDGQVAILQAADLRTVRELNLRAHTAAVTAGAVTREGVTLHDGLTAGVGDRVVARRNQRRIRTTDGYVRNGSLWDVAAVEPDGSLRARPAAGIGPGRDHAAMVRLPAQYVAEHVELGYATTTARTQGVTVDETHTVAAAGMAREDLYVAMSRGRTINHTYVVTDEAPDDCLPALAASPSSYRDVLDGILATSHAEQSATETWDAYHPDQRAPVPPLRPPHDYGRSPQTRLSAPPAVPAPVRDAPVLGI